MSLFYTIIALVCLMLGFCAIVGSLAFESKYKIVNTICDFFRIIFLGIDFLMIVAVIENMAW